MADVILSKAKTVDVPVDEQHSAFNELLVAEPQTLVHLQFPYNINTEIVEARENNLGSVTQDEGMAVVQSGAAANSAAHMLSKHPLRYTPGQGALARFTALFTTGVPDSLQIIGVGEVGDGLFFGYNGAAFSILRRTFGRPEVQTLTISAGAGTATGNITINLDGVAKVVAVEIGDSAREVAVKIADADFSDTGLGWSADVDNATVIFRAWSAGDKAGAFTLDDSGDTTGAAGTFDETIVGVATTNEWVTQTAWNRDNADGTGLLPVIDFTKGNVFQIRYQWLGYGFLEFSIEHPEDGKFRTVHVIPYANANTMPSFQNPTLPLHMMAWNNANTSNLTIKSSSMAGITEGNKPNAQGFSHGDSNSITDLDTTERPIISLKNNLIHQSKLNRVRIEPGFVTLATESTKPAIFRLRIDPTLTGTPAFTDSDAATSVSSVDTAASGLTGGRVIFTIVLGKTDSQIVNLATINKMLNPGEMLTVTAEAVSGSNQEVTVGLDWNELF